ncbi:hypothetical protein Pelo_13423 [Pelomyxa schiedti]|nr:hypothetical protein Pelo_13423 [Pelomyxa schiedti]
MKGNPPVTVKYELVSRFAWVYVLLAALVLGGTLMGLVALFCGFVPPIFTILQGYYLVTGFAWAVFLLPGVRLMRQPSWKGIITFLLVLAFCNLALTVHTLILRQLFEPGQIETFGHMCLLTLSFLFFGMQSCFFDNLCFRLERFRSIFWYCIILAVGTSLTAIRYLTDSSWVMAILAVCQIQATIQYFMMVCNQDILLGKPRFKHWLLHGTIVFTSFLAPSIIIVFSIAFLYWLSGGITWATQAWWMCYILSAYTLLPSSLAGYYSFNLCFISNTFLRFLTRTAVILLGGPTLFFAFLRCVGLLIPHVRLHEVNICFILAGLVSYWHWFTGGWLVRRGGEEILPLLVKRDPKP